VPARCARDLQIGIGRPVSASQRETQVERRNVLVDQEEDALLLAGASNAADGQIFNVGGTRPMSLLDIAASLVEVAGTGTVRLVPWPAERKSIDIGSVYMDDTKIRQVLG
jgi:UDP-glucose 4-epimerase